MNVDPNPAACLLDQIFVKPELVHEAAALIRREDFQLEDHRRVFDAMLDLAEKGTPPDVPVVIDKLTERGMGPDAATDLVLRILDAGSSDGQLRHYAVLVRKHARRRRLIAAAEAAVLKGQANVDPDEILGDLQTTMWELQADRPESGPILAHDFVPGFLERAAIERKQPSWLRGISTGIPGLDATTTGLRPGEFWVVGSLPGRGKTSLGTQIAVRAAERGVPVLLFSLEMSCDEIVRRVLGSRHGCWALRHLAEVADDTWEAIVKHAAEVSTLPLFVDDCGSPAPTKLLAQARVAVRRHGIKLIVVDYLQLLRGPEREIRERVSNAANQLRQLAKETQVPVLALSQLRRPANLNDRPTMIDLKESGDIEAHAHTVLLLYQPMDNTPPKRLDEIIIGKQRNGPLGTVPVVFDTRTLVFKERTTEEAPVTSGRSWTGERDD